MSLDYGKPLPLAVKQVGTDQWEVSGLLSTFGNVDEGGDVVLPGAFDASLQSGRKVTFLFGHDDTKVLGPPLDLKVTDAGLFATGKISRTTLGADVHTLLLDGALDSWSIGYVPTEFDFQDGPKGMIRRLKAVDLFEGSLVAVPMNASAIVTGVKSHDGADPADPESPPADPPLVLPPDPTAPPPEPAPEPEGDTAEEKAICTGALAYPEDWGEHAESVLKAIAVAEAQIAGFYTRARVRADLRAKIGRYVSVETRDLMQKVAARDSELAAAFDALRHLAAETAPPPKGYRPRLDLMARHLALAGVAEAATE